MRVDVVRLDAIEVVLGLRVHEPEDGVSVGLPVDVRDAPVVASDRDVLRLLLPSGLVGIRGALGGGAREACAGDEEEDELVHGEGPGVMASQFRLSHARGPEPSASSRKRSNRLDADRAETAETAGYCFESTHHHTTSPD